MVVKRGEDKVEGLDDELFGNSLIMPNIIMALSDMPSGVYVSEIIGSTPMAMGLTEGNITDVVSDVLSNGKKYCGYTFVMPWYSIDSRRYAFNFNRAVSGLVCVSREFGWRFVIVGSTREKGRTIEDALASVDKRVRVCISKVEFLGGEK